MTPKEIVERLRGLALIPGQKQTCLQAADLIDRLIAERAAEHDKMKELIQRQWAALSWLADHEPGLVALAEERFDLKPGAEPKDGGQ